jgi:hypothetical protein
MSEHKATPEQWALLEEQSAPEYDNTILELRARVEALEATQHAHVDLSGVPESERQQMLESLKKPAKIQLLPLEQDHPQVVGPTPAGSLVERVATAMQPGTFDYSIYEPEVRAAIREVAAWLRESGDYDANAWASLLQDESNRG